MINSSNNLRLAFYIDVYDKDEKTGKVYLVDRIKTYSKSDYNTMCYNLSDRITNKYTKMEEY